MDVLTKAQRSYNMSRIRSKNTKPEVLMFSLLENKGLKFEKHFQKIAGKPDIAFPRQKIAIFIDGELWHGKDFALKKSTFSLFWFNKISSNIRRDRRNVKLLRRDGWHVLRLWGKNILKYPDRSLNRIITFLNKHSLKLKNKK